MVDAPHHAAKPHRSHRAEGSIKAPKGAKGAHFLTHTLRHSSCSLRALGRLNFEVAERNRLTVYNRRAYSGHVANKDATGFGDSIYTRRTTAPRRVFFVRAIASPMSGSGGDTFGYAGFPVYRFANPAICCSPRLATGCVASKHTRETIMSSTATSAPSHIEQVRRLAGIADTIGAMLSVFALLPPAGQDDAIAVSASLADDLAQQLAAIVGGAA
jgi:hypothetical protein